MSFAHMTPLMLSDTSTGTPALLDLPGDLSDALEHVEEAAADACADAFGDLSGSGDYRRAMARVYARRALEAATR